MNIPTCVRALFSVSVAAAVLAGPALAQQGLEEADREAYRMARERRLRNPHPYTAGCPPTVTQIIYPGAQTPTGFDEEIYVMTPCNFNPPAEGAPLIVAFNGFCLGPFSFFNGLSGIPDEANVRQWIVMAVTNVDKKSYGNADWQSNVEYAIEQIIADPNYPVDTSRIYAVGWSAGGGAVASYHARHLDPTRPMFAAIATNAGTLDLVDTYNNVTQDVKNHMENTLFGGPPSGASLFNYLKSSSELIDPVAATADLTVSQMVNLVATPVYHVYSVDDTVVYLPLQNSIFAGFMASAGGVFVSTSFTGHVPPHDFDLLDPVATLDFFQDKVLDPEPSSYEILADRNARYYWTRVQQRQAGGFSHLEAQAATQSLSLSGLSNVVGVILDPPASLIDRTQSFTIDFETSDTGTSAITMSGVNPTAVGLDGELFTNWSYNSGTDTFSATVPGPGSVQLQVLVEDQTGALGAPANASIGANVSLSLQATKPSKPYFLLIGFDAALVPLSLFDPGDPRHLLVAFSPVPALAAGVLDSSGQSSVQFSVPNDPNLIGTELHMQFVTYPGGSTIVDEISNEARTDIGS